MSGPSGRRGYGQPGAFLTRRLAIAVFVALAMIAGAAGNPAAFAQTTPTQDDVDFELKAAKAERASAAAPPSTTSTRSSGEFSTSRTIHPSRVVSPKGSVCLGRPSRLDVPAARMMAAVWVDVIGVRGSPYRLCAGPCHKARVMAKSVVSL